MTSRLKRTGFLIRIRGDNAATVKLIAYTRLTGTTGPRRHGQGDDGSGMKKPIKLVFDAATRDL